MKLIKQSLALLLVLCMLVGVMPVNVLAANETNSTESVMTNTEENTEDVDVAADTSKDFMKVFHLDCGRKYFTVDQVKELIDALSNAGFSHMELAVGNDGLRLLLDDMSISANGTTYDSETIKSGIKSGNKTYSHSGEWSQSEMDTIIAYAATKGIEIIPLVNNPGHMDSILAAMKACGIDGYYKASNKTSARTVNLENTNAVAFTQALVMKYAEYFAGKGCKYFNIGADEYANDVHTSDSIGMGFGYLVTNKKYGNFVTYVNTLVEDICDLGMTPIAFNDGIYYNSTTTQGTFDNRLIVAAWSGGWGGIKPAKTDFLASKGHQILNTNERWYYVLGRKQSVNGTYCYESALSKAQSVAVTTVMDEKGTVPMGAMQCVWCDDPAVNYETYKANVMTLIKTLADNNPTYFTGPNEPVEPEVPEVPESVTKTDEETKIAITAPGLTGLAITEIQAPVVEGAAQNKVLAWNITPATANGNYVGEAEVSVPVPADWKNVRGGVLASDNGQEVMDIKGKLENGVFTFIVPHFSTAVVYEIDSIAVEYDEEIELTVGQKVAFTIQNADYDGDYATNPDGIATVIAKHTKVDGETNRNIGTTVNMSSNTTYKGLIYNGTYYLVMDASGNISSTRNINEATVFSVVRSGSSSNRNYTISNESRYLSVSSNRLTSSSSSYSWKYNNGFQTSSYYRLTCPNGTWTLNYNSGTRGNLYNYTETVTNPVNESTITFTGVSAGITFTTVGATVYKIVVNKKTESATLSIGDNITYTDNSKNVPVVENSAIATATINNGVLTIIAKAEGTTKVITDNAEYTIKVIPFNPADVSKVPVYLWITSHPITADGSGVSELEISVEDSNVYSAEGAKLTDLIPFTGKDPQNETNKDTIHNLWQVRLQHEGAKQTSGGSDDKTNVGEQVEYIRYYGGKWQVKDTSGTWLDVASTDQLTAYYLMKSPLTDEVDSLVKDWGFQFKDGQKYWQYFDESSYAALSAQVIYEDGSMNPDTKANNSDAPLIDTTVFFNFWAKGQDNHTANRDIGYFLPQFNEQYEIYKITTMHGSCSVTARNDNASAASVNYGNPDPNDEDEVIVWQIGDGTPELIGKDGNDALQWRNHKDAILIRIYLRAKVTEDSLNVIYYDEKFGDELYSYNISVDAGVNFTNDITPKPGAFAGNAERIDVTNCTIQNKNDVTQYLQTDLTKVPEAIGKYNNDLYRYTGSKISDDGKTLYLYYNIDTEVLSPNYVVDFGLPLKFKLDELLGENTSVGAVDKVGALSARYGTLTYDAATTTFTYTPNKILQNIDVLSINLTMAGKSATTNVGVTPATTVFYEESFINYDSNWAVPNAPTKMQATEVLGESSYYGYDAVYSGDNAGSNSTFAESKATGAGASFTFTGTGFELYANSKPASGFVTVYSQGELNKLYMINTKLTDIEGAEIEGATYYSLPVISETDLPHGTYTVQIKQTNGEKPIYIDGVRIVNTIDESGKEAKDSIYINDEEDKPVFHELRDYVLNAIGVENLEESDYIGSGDRESKVKKVEEMAGQVYNALDGGDKAVLINKEGTTFTQDQAQDLLDNGPKNEVYLYPGQTLAFSVTTDRVMQLGLKAPTGSAEFDLSVDGEAFDLKKLTTTVDMFYKIAEKGDSTKHTVSITVNSGMLSVTDLKICDDPNATFNELTQEDIENVLLGIYGLNEEPQEPEVTYADAILNINLKNNNGEVLGSVKLTANGVEGETMTFTATEIQAAVEATVLPENYKLAENTYSDVEVAYGEEMTISFAAEEVVVEEPDVEEEEETSIIVKLFNTIKSLLKKIFG